jgi:hypothetical protein
MSGRPPPTAAPAALRLEVLKELQQLIDNRDSRDRIDRGPLAETKGREHWVLHLLLRAQESNQSHFDTLIGTAYSNLLSRLQAVDDRVSRVEEQTTSASGDLRERVEAVSVAVGERMDRGFSEGLNRLSGELGTRVLKDLDQLWKPIGESIETFAISSREVLKDVADTYRVATQTRLLLNENARRITDLSRDLLALEDSLKLVITKAIDEALVPLEQRVAGLEAHAGIAPNGGAPARESSDHPESPAGGT